MNFFTSDFPTSASSISGATTFSPSRIYVTCSGHSCLSCIFVLVWWRRWQLDHNYADFEEMSHALPQISRHMYAFYQTQAPTLSSICMFSHPAIPSTIKFSFFNALLMICMNAITLFGLLNFNQKFFTSFVQFLQCYSRNRQRKENYPNIHIEHAQKKVARYCDCR